MPLQQDVFIPGINWGTLGYAAFFPITGAPQLYLARKRPFVLGVPSNNPDNFPNFANLFNYATSMHTERQLIIAALVNHLAPCPVVQNAGANIINGGLNILNAVDVRMLAEVGLLQGDLHVYTDKNPCQNCTNDNGFFSCIDYYNSLANFIRGLNLHIYFPRSEMRLNREFFSKNLNAAEVLCTFVQFNLVTGFRIEDGWLKCDRKGRWVELVQQTLTGWEVRRNAKIGLLVNQVNNAIMNNRFSALQLNQLFNQTHNTANISRIVYHPIPSKD